MFLTVIVDPQTYSKLMSCNHRGPEENDRQIDLIFRRENWDPFFAANGMGTFSDKLKTLVKMKNWVCLKITGVGKDFHRLRIPFFLCTSDLTNSIVLAAQDPNKKMSEQINSFITHSGGAGESP
jgi:hypothetical protein